MYTMILIKISFIWELELNGFIVLFVIIGIIIALIFIYRNYKKHHLEINKMSFLFGLFGFEYEPIKDKEKMDLYQEIENKNIEIQNLKNELKILKKDASISVIAYLILFFALLGSRFKNKFKNKKKLIK